jgi:hypothetical protein
MGNSLILGLWGGKAKRIPPKISGDNIRLADFVISCFYQKVGFSVPKLVKEISSYA